MARRSAAGRTVKARGPRVGGSSSFSRTTTLPRKKARAYGWSVTRRDDSRTASRLTGTVSHGARDRRSSRGSWHFGLGSWHGDGYLRAYHTPLGHHRRHHLRNFGHSAHRSYLHFYGGYARCYTPSFSYFGAPYDPFYSLYVPDYYTSSVTLYDREPAYVRQSYSDNVFYITDSAAGDVPADVYASTGSVSARGSTTDMSSAPAPPSDTSAVVVGPPQPTLIDDGDRAFAAGKYDEARRFYMGAILADDDDGYAKFFYGIANFAASDYRAASAAIRRALIVTPDLIDYPIDVRSLYPDQYSFETQLAGLVRFVEARHDDPEGMFLLGYLYYASVEPERALAVLLRQTRAHPSDEVAALVRDAALRVVGADK